MSQTDLILSAMQRGERFTALKAIDPPYRCMRLASRISDLKRKGYTIQTRTIKTPSGKRVSEYWMIIENAPSLFGNSMSRNNGHTSEGLQ